MRQEMKSIVKFCLSYGGNESDSHQIDLYDVSQALIGLQRSIALTTHLVINGEIITQAPALKGARILAGPVKEGSWEIVVTVLAAIYAISTAKKDTPLGHIVYSVYDYVVSQCLGVPVDYNKSLWQIVEKYKKQRGKDLDIEQNKVDSLIEKCTTAITDIHRPIFKNKTATSANIIAEWDSRQIKVGPELTLDTFDYIHEEFTEEKPVMIKGQITSYNSRSYKGRISVASERWQIPFELEEYCRADSVIALVTASAISS